MAHTYRTLLDEHQLVDLRAKLDDALACRKNRLRQLRSALSKTILVGLGASHSASLTVDNVRDLHDVHDVRDDCRANDLDPDALDVLNPRRMSQSVSATGSPCGASAIFNALTPPVYPPGPSGCA